MTNKMVFTVAYYHDVELNAGARDASSTCSITVTLTSSSKAVCHHTDVCIRRLSYCSVKLLSLLVQAYDLQLGLCGEREGYCNICALLDNNDM